MRGFFNLDNGFFQTMSKLFDLMFVSILWVIFSMPVITMGPATVALYYVTVKVVRKERGYVFAEFWKSFKENFLTGIIYMAVILGIGFLFYVNFEVINFRNTTWNLILFYIYWMFLFIISSTVVYLFPLLSRFSLKRFQLVKMSLMVSMKHLPKTLIILMIVVVSGVSMYIVPALTAILPGLCALFTSFPLEKVMKRYLPEPDKNLPEDELEWYYSL